MNTQTILEVINNYYNNGECRLNEDLPDGERGDGLADFIVNEVKDLTHDGETTTSVYEVIGALLTAKEQLADIVEGLRHARTVYEPR